ncbi:MAG TPA: hypothetical protein VLM40_18975, partial [Gemmata sp.]|nr:hypothetical protein [Gemmata sp.]
MSIRTQTILAGMILASLGNGRASAQEGPYGRLYSSAPAALAAGPCGQVGGCSAAGGGLTRYTAASRAAKCNQGDCSASRPHFQGKKEPFAITLCPGACFGYFQTQWRKWDDVCPIPYIGSAGAKGSVPQIPYYPPSSDQPVLEKKGDGSAPMPRPGDSKPMPKAGESKTGMLPMLPMNVNELPA